MLRLKSSPLASVVGRLLLVSGLALSVLSQATAAHAAPANAGQVDLAAVVQTNKAEFARGETFKITASAVKVGPNTGPATMTIVIPRQFGYPLIVENSGFMCSTRGSHYLNSPTWEMTCRKSLIAPGTKTRDTIALLTSAPNRAMSSAVIVAVRPDNATDVRDHNNVAQRDFRVR